MGQFSAVPINIAVQSFRNSLTDGIRFELSSVLKKCSHLQCLHCLE